MAEVYRSASGEYGATTGRPRDVGRFDCVETRKVLATNMVDVLCLTKVDMFPHIPEIKHGLSYHIPSTGREYLMDLPTLELKFSDLEVRRSKSVALTEDIV